MLYYIDVNKSEEYTKVVFHVPHSAAYDSGVLCVRYIKNGQSIESVFDRAKGIVGGRFVGWSLYEVINPNSDNGHLEVYTPQYVWTTSIGSEVDLYAQHVNYKGGNVHVDFIMTKDELESLRHDCYVYKLILEDAIEKKKGKNDEWDYKIAKACWEFIKTEIRTVLPYFNSVHALVGFDIDKPYDDLAFLLDILDVRRAEQRVEVLDAKLQELAAYNMHSIRVKTRYVSQSYNDYYLEIIDD